jgi:hypothetical protein
MDLERATVNEGEKGERRGDIKIGREKAPPQLATA